MLKINYSREEYLTEDFTEIEQCIPNQKKLYSRVKPKTFKKLFGDCSFKHTENNRPVYSWVVDFKDIYFIIISCNYGAGADTKLEAIVHDDTKISFINSFADELNSRLDALNDDKVKRWFKLVTDVGDQLLTTQTA